MDDEQRVAAIRERAESDAHWARPRDRAEAHDTLWLLDRLRTVEADKAALIEAALDHRATASRALAVASAAEARVAEAESVIAGVQAWVDGEPFEISAARVPEPVETVAPDQAPGFVHGHAAAVRHVAAILDQARASQ